VKPADLVGRRAALATRHRKEVAIGPALGLLGLEVVVADVDTDGFGTFTGTVPRAGTPLEAALAKAAAGLDRDPAAALGLASEGAYGQEPGIELVAARFASGVAVVGRHLAWDVPSGGIEAATVEEGLRFADAHPGLAFVVGAVPGIARDALEDALAAAGPGARLQIDLRAMVHPARMDAVGAAAADLARRLASACPACGGCGWGREAAIPGLPCADCGVPTSAPRADRSRCPWCGHEVVAERAGRADPAECGVCNP
jgi:hypothetical protein